MKALDEALVRGMEGVIIKNQQSKYGLNERSNMWIKIKPDYCGKLLDTLDLLILGGYYGKLHVAAVAELYTVSESEFVCTHAVILQCCHCPLDPFRFLSSCPTHTLLLCHCCLPLLYLLCSGEGTRRSGDISHFLLGVAAPYDKAKGEKPKEFYTFGKVGSGYSYQELTKLRAHLKEKWRPYNENKQPAFFMGWKHERQDRPDMYLNPEDAVVIELKCYEITPCRKNKFHAE